MPKFPRVSIVVATYNRRHLLEQSLQAFEKQDYPSPIEVIVIDDGSTDDTKDVVGGFDVHYFQRSHEGADAAKNFGIRKSRYPIVVIMDDDCIPEKTWLKELISELKPGVGGVSSFSPTGGTSTAFVKRYIERIGLFDLRFNRYNFRDDTDLVFRLLDTGKRFVHIEGKARFLHIHSPPQGMKSIMRYFWKRLWIHSVDPLLYKKHAKRTKKFLDIKWGFLRNPLKDFRTATGLWHKDVGYSLSSPQGVTFLENKSPFHATGIFLSGLLYVLLVKLYRFYGSMKYGKLLL